MKNTKTELFETMPVGRALLAMAIPTIVSQLITMIYNLADTFFIGMSEDPYKVAASSLVAVLFFMLNSLANLFYTFVCGHMNWTMIVYCFVSLIGNLIGGVMVSVLPLLKKKDEPKKYKCPCCGYYTLDNEGMYDICPVCFWEDNDEVEDPNEYDDCNKISLAEARKNYLE